MAYGCSSAWWRGVSLSKANSPPAWPTSTGRRLLEPAHRVRHGGQPQAGPLAGLYAGSSGLHDSACRMSVSSSSWCCCSWFRPSVTSGPITAQSRPALREQRLHRLVDMPAVRMHLVHRGPREQAALRARMARAERLVVRVEEVVETHVERLVALGVRLQQHGLEEPRGVREVPLGRARIGHRLDALVFGGKRGGEREARGAHLAKLVAQCARRLRGRPGKRHGVSSRVSRKL
jgi:hypothetical protein